jgi:hypothetical protein
MHYYNMEKAWSTVVLGNSRAIKKIGSRKIKEEGPKDL